MESSAYTGGAFTSVPYSNREHLRQPKGRPQKSLLKGFIDFI